MSTWAGGLYGGGGSAPGALGAVVETPVSDLIYHALRLAQVTLGPDRVPSNAQFNDGLRAGSRMLGIWNADGLKVPAILVESFPLTAGQKVYRMGPGGDFSTSRPQRIMRANLISPAGIRRQIEVIEVDRWADIRQQDLAGEPDRVWSDKAPGLANLYFYPQIGSDGYQAEFFGWKLLERLESKDATVIWPEGYEEAFVHNLAIRLAAMFGTIISPDVRQIARESLSDLISYNADAPTMACDGAVMPQSAYGYYDWQVNE